MARVVKIAIAQINCVVGDLAGQRRQDPRILRTRAQRRRGLDADPGARAVRLPPEDLLLRDGFYRDCKRPRSSAWHAR